MTEPQSYSYYNPEDEPILNNQIEDLLQDLDPLDENEDFFADPTAELKQLRQENLSLKAELAAKENPPNSQDYTDLVAQLETAIETVKNQQLLIETLSQQLEETQNQQARLERECTQVQEHYHQQTYKLLETEKQLQELHKRLLRQQRYTLEYKTTLERCFKEQSSLIIDKANSGQKNQSVAPWSSSEITPAPTVEESKKVRPSLELPKFLRQ